MSPTSLPSLAVLALLLLASSPWTLFPLALALLPRQRTKSPTAPARVRLSVLVPAHNEAATIEGKIRDTLAALDAVVSAEGARHELLVLCDGCTDLTEVLARRVNDPRLTVLARATRRGKPTTLNELVARARGDVLVFTDASTRLGASCLARLADALMDAGVGAATARYVVGDDPQGGGAPPDAQANPERRAWSVDAWLRARASSRGVLVGGSGAALAVKRAAWIPLPTDTINDDYAIPLALARQGLRTVWVADAVVSDAPTSSVMTTFHRHARIAAGNVQMIARAGRALLAPRIGLPLLLHKAPKVALPWLCVAAAALAVVDVALTGGTLVTCGVALAALALSVCAGPMVAGALRASPRVTASGLRGTISHACAALAGVALGGVRGVRGGVDVRWRRPETEAASDSEEERARVAGLAPVPASVRAIKRVVDVVGALVGLALFAPVIAVLAALVKADSRGPAFYGQERVRCDAHGQAGTFTMWKLRTMRVDAEQASGPVWAQADDPRITRMGAFLRATRLDELPQLWNVLRGEMSLVGPRPERPAFVEKLEQLVPGYAERVRRTRPGITGWAQIHCAYDATVDDVRRKVLYDLAYVAHLYRFSTFIRIELHTIVATVAVMVLGRGAR